MAAFVVAFVLFAFVFTLVVVVELPPWQIWGDGRC